MEKIKEYLERVSISPNTGKPTGWRATAAEVIKLIISVGKETKKKS